MSWAGITRCDTIISPQMDACVRQADISARLVEFDPQGLAQTASTHPFVRSGRAVTARSGSSMAPALVHHFDAAASPPSLCSYADTDATPTETSISTGLASQISGVVLLEERNGILQVPPAPARTPVYECAFWFLSCGAMFASKQDWETHCLSHFRGEEPPRAVQCPLCDWSTAREDGFQAWQLRMQHLAYAHTMLGQTLRTSRPDFHLFQHLWQKRLIDDHDLKELKGGNHNLTRLPGNYVETNVRPGRRRRDRASQRTQHVAANRPAAPRRA